jgi:Transposase, Mutator family
MALDHAALLEVLDALKAGDADERVRVAAETMYQALIETELSATIGAQPWERSPSRSNQRNGSRSRTVSTTAGDLRLRIPKLLLFLDFDDNFFDKNVLADLDADLVTVGDSDVLQFVDQTVITTFPRTWPFSSNRMASGASSSG